MLIMHLRVLVYYLGRCWWFHAHEASCILEDVLDANHSLEHSCIILENVDDAMHLKLHVFWRGFWCYALETSCTLEVLDAMPLRLCVSWNLEDDHDDDHDNDHDDDGAA